jgi:hypothetical protein
MPVVRGRIIDGIGPVLELLVGVGRERADAMQGVGRTAAAPVRCRALLDTGACASSVDLAIIEGLGLVPIGQRPMLGMTTGPFAFSFLEFVVSLSLEIPSLHAIDDSLRVTGLPLSRPQFAVIIGRDILDRTCLTYDGRRGRFRWRLDC